MCGTTDESHLFAFVLYRNRNSINLAMITTTEDFETFYMFIIVVIATVFVYVICLP